MEKYIKPEISVIEICLEQTILSASNGINSLSIDDEKTTDSWD